MKKVALVFFPILFCMQTSFAQDDSKNSVSVTPIEGGKIISTFNDQTKGDFYGVDLGYQIKDVSIDASYLDMHNVSLQGMAGSKGLLGSSYGLTANLNMTLFNVSNTAVICAPGIGFEYITQTFHTDGNLIVGSHLNFALQAGIGFETPLSSSVKLKMMANLSHFSNASIKLPNDGLNIATISLSLVKSIGHDGPLLQKEAWGTDDKTSFEFGIGAGLRGYVKTGYFYNQQHVGMYLTDSAEKKEHSSNLYQIGIYAGYNYRVNSVFGLRVGTDAVYYTHPFSYDNFFKTYQASFSSYDQMSLGVSIGADLNLGRLAFAANYGRYVHSKFLDPTVHDYWTFGPKYYVTDWMALTVKVYFHGIESGYANFGLTFRI